MTTNAGPQPPSKIVRWIFITASIVLAVILLIIFAQFIYSLFTLNNP
jgi:hypothetical protein